MTLVIELKRFKEVSNWGEETRVNDLGNWVKKIEVINWAKRHSCKWPW